MKGKSAFQQVFRALSDAEKQLRQKGGEYWQGKKDGLRIAMVLLSPTEEEKETYTLLRETSSSARMSERELLIDLVQEADSIIAFAEAWGMTKGTDSYFKEFRERLDRLVKSDQVPAECQMEDAT